MKKPLMLAVSGLAGLTLGLAGCGDDKENGGDGTSTTIPTVSTGTSTEDTTTGFTTTGEDEGTTTGEDNGGNSGKGGGDDG